MDEVILQTLIRALIAAVPLLIATLGEIITEKSGVLNLGAEGIMSVSAVGAFVATLSSGSLIVGTMFAILLGVLMAAIHSLASITLRANQTVSGLAITMLGTGILGVWGQAYVGIQLPYYVQPLVWGPLEQIPVLGRVLAGLDIFFWIALALAGIVYFVFKHTKTGILLRTVGENPRVAEAHGIRVQSWRWAATLCGGAFFGLAAAFLALSYNHSWTQDATGGRGWIAVALTIFALWRPLRAIGAALLFGGIYVAQFSLQGLGISTNLLAMLPYLATLGILIVGASRLKAMQTRLHVESPDKTADDKLQKQRRKKKAASLQSAPAALGESWAPGER